MSILAERPPAAPPAAPSPPGGRRAVAGLPWGRLAHPAVVPALAMAAAAAWAPFVARPLSSDEGGYLMVASQWSPGTSLYGNYWVDRPPLLIGLFQLADLGGGAVALRLMGIAAVVMSVFLAASLGRRAAPRSRHAAVLAAATAAVFLATPLFGTTEVDGEVLAVPFVLAGLVAALRAADAATAPRAIGWWVVAGVAATAAGGVKQNMLEVFVAAGATIAWLLWTRQPGRAARAAAGFATGSLGALIVMLCWAASRGTEPAALWDAVVTFRGQAAALISTSATSSTDARGARLALSFLVSGAGAVLLTAAIPRRSRSGGADVPPTARARHAGFHLGIVAVAVLAWEVFGVVAGGSYWLHYLIGLVPGLVLAVIAAVNFRPSRLRWIVGTLSYSGAAAVVAVIVLLFGAAGPPSSGVQAEQYLSRHSRPGDTGVVAFGDPALLQAAHLRSPYPLLWSLPVRVADPHLTEFAHVLTSRNRPTWVVVNGTSLATWGVDATHAQSVLDREYHPVHTAGDWHLYHLDSRRRPA